MKVNQLKAGAVMSYLLIGLGGLISIVYTPIMLRLLGQSEYGLYNLVGSVVSYLGLLNFGFGSVYIKYYSAYRSKNEVTEIAKLNGMFMIIFSIMGIIAVLAGMILVFNTDIVFGNQLTIAELSKAKILLTIMVFNIAFTSPCIVFNSYVSAKEAFVFQKGLQIVKVLTSPFLILPILIMGYASVGMVLVTTALNITIELINIWYAFRKLKIKFSFKKFDFSLLKEIAVFSSFIFMNLVVNQINWNVDRFIIGWFNGTVAVAKYSLAAQLNTYYISLSTAMSTIFIPRVNKMVAEKAGDFALSELFARLGRLQFILLSLILSSLIFFGIAFIKIWAGDDYEESYPIALLLIIPVTIPLIQNLGIEIQRAKNMHYFRSWIYLGIAILNVGISIPLVKLYGGVGAALGTSLALIIGNILIMNWYYHKKVGMDIIYFSKQIGKILPSLILPAITGILMFKYLNLENIKVFVLSASVYVIVFVLSMWFIGLNKYEKKLVIKPYLQISNRFFKKNNLY